MKYRLP